VLCGVLSVWWFHGGRPWKTHVHSGRGLKVDGDELKWAETTFGVFLKGAIPKLEESKYHATNWINNLAEGDCKAWASAFAEKGTFSFNIPSSQQQLATRGQVLKYCKENLSHIKGMRLRWDFPDMARLSGVAQVEVFSQPIKNEPVQKSRWALYASVVNSQITKLNMFSEARKGDPLPAAIDAAVQANIKRLNKRDCGGFESALPSSKTETWSMQSLPDGSSKGMELDEKPRDKILGKCRQEVKNGWKLVDFQYSYVDGIFSSANGRTFIVFFHNERMYKGIADVTDDPEALMIQLTDDPLPSIHELHFSNVEGVHLSEEWGWKYGWESRQQRWHWWR